MTAEQIIAALDTFWGLPKEERTMETLSKTVPGITDMVYQLAKEISELKKRVEGLENKPKRPSGGYNL